MSKNHSWIQTYTGKKFYPLNPTQKSICIEDIAHALSMLCRYTGHCNRFYSVAEHSVLISRKFLGSRAKFGLLHDAAETYLNDIAKPVKINLPDYERMSDIVELAIAKKFGLTYSALVKQADKQIYLDERAQLFDVIADPWRVDYEKQEKLGVTIAGWSPKRAEKEFLKRWKEVENG